jgi:hypothetical protein
MRQRRPSRPRPKPNGEWGLATLNALPTLSVSQADSLKVDNGNYRVWLSRCTVADGEPYPNKVTVERRVNDKWVQERPYEAT